MAESVTLDADGDGTLTALEIFTLLMAESKANGNGDPKGVVTGTAIVLRESGGKIRAYRDQTKNSGGGNDRGIWQFNDKYHPDVTDAIAYDPVAATKAAYVKSGGFTHFTPWDGAKLTFGQLSTAQEAAGEAGYKVMTSLPAGTTSGSFDVGDIPIIGGAIEGAIDVGKGAISWTQSLGDLLGNLLSGDWWKRVGIGILGAIVIVIGLVLMFKNSVTNAATGGLINATQSS